MRVKIDSRKLKCCYFFLLCVHEHFVKKFTVRRLSIKNVKNGVDPAVCEKINNGELLAHLE